MLSKVLIRIFAISKLLSLSSAGAPAASPLAHGELICAENDPSDCYPKLFQATEKFQLIRDGQDIEPGLHVRLNVYTGEREARLNIPMNGEDTSASMAVESSVVTVERGSDNSHDDNHNEIDKAENLDEHEADNIHSSAPHKHKFSLLATAADAIINESDQLDKWLVDLEELAHDVEYGESIAQDGMLLRKLVCLMTTESTSSPPERARKSAAIIAAALQNNPTALEELEWRGVAKPNCNSKGPRLLIDVLQRAEDDGHAATKTTIATLSGFLKHKRLRDELLRQGIMEYLLAIIINGKDETGQRVAQLVMDTFLDETMGAELDVWPQGKVNPPEICAAGSRSDGCWDFHVSEIATKRKQPWARELAKSIKGQREKYTKALPEKEL